MMPQNAALQFTLPEQSDWCDNMLIRPYDYVPMNVSRPYFSMGPQGMYKGLGMRLPGRRLEARTSE